MRVVRVGEPLSNSQTESAREREGSWVWKREREREREKGRNKVIPSVSSTPVLQRREHVVS